MKNLLMFAKVTPVAVAAILGFIVATLFPAIHGAFCSVGAL